MRIELNPQTRGKLNLASAVLFGVSAAVWAPINFAIAATCILLCGAYAIAYRRDARKAVPVMDRRESTTSQMSAAAAPSSDVVWQQQAPKLFLIADNSRTKKLN